MFPCIPVLCAADVTWTLGDSNTANDTTYRENYGLILHILLFRMWCRQCIHRYFICPHEHCIKSDMCHRICVDTSANYHVNGVSLNFTLRCKYLFACRCQGWYHGNEPTDKTGALTDVQPLHLGE